MATISEARDAAHALNWLTIASLAFRQPSLRQAARKRSVLRVVWSAAGVYHGYSASDARVAFGGVKKSGFGRELSHFGLHEFCNIQTVWKDRR